ncbi:uncharacterized protein [Drosophila suzukii]|uniref:MADF domain-containing protein n=1 Tax=Drosophila suzukii TaxID=28584 RepID=A0ABM4TXN7_DROSZ
MLVGHSHVTGAATEGGFRGLESPARDNAPMCGQVRTTEPREPQRRLHQFVPRWRIAGLEVWRCGGVEAGTQKGLEQKLTLTGLTRLRTSVETVARTAGGERGWGVPDLCGVDDDGAPSSLSSFVFRFKFCTAANQSNSTATVTSTVSGTSAAHNQSTNAEEEDDDPIHTFLNMESYFEKELITLIQQEDMIYNYGNVNYRNVKLKMEVWEEIARKLKKSVKQCRLKWKPLRDQYAREHKRLRTLMHIEATSRWKHYDSLSFLQKYMKQIFIYFKVTVVDLLVDFSHLLSFDSNFVLLPITAHNQSTNAEEEDDDPIHTFLNMESYFEKELITLIQQEDMIYNYGNVNYRNVKLKMEVWEEIARKLKKSVKQCRLKWKALRDQYAREHKRLRTLMHIEATSRWKHYDSLSNKHLRTSRKNPKILPCFFGYHSILGLQLFHRSSRTAPTLSFLQKYMKQKTLDSDAQLSIENYINGDAHHDNEEEDDEDEEMETTTAAEQTPQQQEQHVMTYDHDDGEDDEIGAFFKAVAMKIRNAQLEPVAFTELQIEILRVINEALKNHKHR